MMTLGDVLGVARRSAAGFEAWLDAADPAFAEELRSAAGGGSLADLACAAVADFSNFADEEAWAALTTTIRDSDDPGTACLISMVRWRLAVHGCADHSLLHQSRNET